MYSEYPPKLQEKTATRSHLGLLFDALVSLAFSSLHHFGIRATVRYFSLRTLPVLREVRFAGTEAPDDFGLRNIWGRSTNGLTNP